MAAKVFDGLFIGDAETSMDADFLDLNKISRLINVAGRQIPNALSGHGFVYKTYFWEDESDYLVFVGMEKDKALLEMVDFIDSSLRKGLSVLLFSARGVSRNAYGFCAFLMFKYYWGFEKSYDFVLSKKKDIQINQGFIQQLFTLEKRLIAKRKREFHGLDCATDSGVLIKERLRRNEWDPSYLRTASSSSALSTASIAKINGNSRSARADEFSDDDVEDELLLVNSYLNSKNTPTSLPGPYRSLRQPQKSSKLRFNGLLLEEDVHVFPTSPPSRYNPPSVPKGILKWNRNGVNLLEDNVVKMTAALSTVDETVSKVYGNRSASPKRPVPATSAPERKKVLMRSTSTEYSISPASAAIQRGREGNVRTLQVNEDNFETDNNSQHRGSQHQPPPLPLARTPFVPELHITAPSTSEVAWTTDAYRNSRDIMNALTAEDCMRSIMRDLRGSSSIVKAGEKTTSNSNRNSDTNGNGNGIITGNSSGHREAPDSFITTHSERALMRSIAALKDRKADMDLAYEDMGALSLHDLAALPLHFEDVRASRRNVHYDGRVSRFDSTIGFDGRKENYDDHNQVLGVEEIDGEGDWSSRARQLVAKSTHFPSSSAVRNHRSEAQEIDIGAPLALAAFQRGGQEGAIRVKYSSSSQSNGSTQPTSQLNSAWSEDPFRVGSDIRPKPKLQQHQASTSSSATKRHHDLHTSDRSSTPTERREERVKDLSVRTYRHGSPAPSRVTTSRAPPPPPFPSSSLFVPQRVRASSPSAARSRDPSPAPGTVAWGTGSIARSGDTPGSHRLQRQSSSDSEIRSGGRVAFLCLQQPHDISASTLKSSGRLNSGGSAAKASRPASPGTRKHRTSNGDLYGIHQSYSNVSSTGRSATPTRGSWR